MRTCFLSAFFLLCSTAFVFAQQKQPPGQPRPIHFSEVAQIEKRSLPAKQALKAAEEWEEEDELESIKKKKRKKPLPAIGMLRPFYPLNIQKREGGAPVFREQSPIPASSFNALDDNGTTIPPDVHGVAGLNHLMVVLNSEFRILSKTGSVVSTVSSTGFWSGVSPDGFADPHVLYDHTANRWVVIGQSDASNSALLVAVSESSDPTGTWFRYAFDVDATNKFWFDFPLAGFNQNWLVVTGNMFNTDGDGWAGKSQIYIFDKTVLYNGETVNFGNNAQLITSAATDYAFSLSPSTNYDASPTMFLIESWDDQAGQLRLSRLRGSIPNVDWAINSATLPANGSQKWRYAPSPGGDFAQQKGDTRKIAVNDDRMNNVILRNGKLWTAHHVFLPAKTTTTRGAIQWWVIDTLTDMPLQIGLIDDPTGNLTRTFPSVAVDAAENMVVGYSVFSSSTYASAAYSFRNACTPVNTMQTEVVYKEGLSAYYKTFGGGRCRWGDYSNTCLDPVTGKFWTIQEYAAQRVNSTDNGSRWGTWWAQISPEASNSVFFGSLVGAITEETATTADCRGYKDYLVTLDVFCQATGNATLHFATTGTAVSGKDFDLIPSSLSFAANETSKAITLRVYNDDEPESTEIIDLSFTITGNGVTAGLSGQTQRITITDNDRVPLATGAFSATFGNGSTTIQNQSFLQSAYTRAKYQYVVLASEMTAKGLSAGNLQGLAFNIVQRGSTGSFTYKGLTIALAPTTATAVNPPHSTGFVQVYSGNYTVSGTGTQTFSFNTPFNWDGTSNVVIQICYDNEGVAPGTGPEVLSGESSVSGSSAPTVFARNNTALPTAAGCNLAFSSASTFRPDITLIGSATGTSIASALNTTYSTYIAPYADVYVYSTAGEIVARIKNNSNHDYGCTQVIVDRTGKGSEQFWNEETSNYLASKTIHVIPANNNPSGKYEITLYYTAAEVAGWQAATGQAWPNATIIKVPQKISSITPATPASGIQVNMSSVPTSFGQHYTISGSFSTGFSGFGVGVPGGSVLPVTLVQFSGQKQQAEVLLTWQTAFEHNNHHYEIESGRNGTTFSRIGTVAAKGNTATPMDYRFFDRQPAKGANYYRLRQVDLNAKTSYSKTVAVVFAANGQSVVVYPNPATDKLTLSFATPQDGIRMNLLAADGRLLRSQNLGAAEKTKEVVISALPRGSYVMELLFAREKQTVSFVKE